MAELTIEALDATLGAAVTGVDLTDLDGATWALVESAFHEYGVLVFPGQHLSAEAQAVFAKRFGDIEHIVADTETVAVSNQRTDGSLLDEDDLRMAVLKGNEGWHTDSSYMPLAAKASVLSAHVVPSSGGGTEWADMRAAYDALDTDTKARVADLSAYHSLKHSQAKIGDTRPRSNTYGFFDGDPPLRSLVKVHPVTGRSSLFLGRHAYGIPGLDAAESERLLEHLLSVACQAPRTFEHRWMPGDVAVWDNRCVLHRARPYDYHEPRVMKHTRIAGDLATELAAL